MAALRGHDEEVVSVAISATNKLSGESYAAQNF
jgi:hypothetical protein